MTAKFQLCKLAVSLGMALVALGSHAQAVFPSKTVTLIVPYGAGGSADVLARALGDKLSKTWHVPVVVDNKSGANGILATQALMRAPADGAHDSHAFDRRHSKFKPL